MNIREELEMQIAQLNMWTKAYDEGKPIVSDKEWDDAYFKLADLERRANIFLPNSPTQNIDYQVVNALEKVKHNHPMLSLAKSKSIEEVTEWAGGREVCLMAKMDGLTCSLHYSNGKLVGAETRGNGEVGENVLHNALTIPSIPHRINYEEDLVIDGEIICTFEDFKEFSETYKNPRNFAAGSIRLLDAAECAKRKLTFIAWDIISKTQETQLDNKLLFLKELGFTIVPFVTTEDMSIEKGIPHISTIAKKEYPIDGIVIKFNDVDYYNSLGKTAHHFLGGIAYKFYDEEYETELLDIEYNVSKRGILTPVAVFKPVNIDETTVERCSLFNISVLEEKLGKPYIGQKIWISKRNAIIPYIEKAEKIS